MLRGLPTLSRPGLLLVAAAWVLAACAGTDDRSEAGVSETAREAGVSAPEAGSDAPDAPDADSPADEAIPEPRVEPGAEVEPGSDPYVVGASRDGTFTVRWRPLPGDTVPENEHFELEVWLYQGTGDVEQLEPLTGAKVFVSGWMPDHFHGMLRKPRTFEQGDGKYLVKGMLLHMVGHWQLFIDVPDERGISERAAFDLHL